MSSAGGSGPKWTPEQLQAITARGSNILVAAAAGSGKTATLVERVIRRLLDPVDPIDVDELLIVTFTEAAATEMRERIGAALQKALEEQPENARLQRQLALLGRAAISTLHSFCLGLLRQYFYRLGLDPALQVMSDHEALLLRAEVLDEIFAERFEQEEPTGPFYQLVDRYGGGRDDQGLRRLVLDLYDDIQSLPWPERWLEEAVARFDLPEEATLESLPWWGPLRRQIHLQLTLAADSLREAARQCRMPGGPVVYEDTLQEEADRVAAAAELAASDEATWEGVASAVWAIEFGRMPAVKKGEADEAHKARVQKLRDQAKKAVRALRDGYFKRSPAEWLADLRAVAPHMRTLADLVLAFGERFREAKAQQSAVDFHDLERFTLKLLLDPEAPPGELRPSEVARELRRRYREILVDEYQDINAVQDAILTLVACDGTDGPPNRFMVGDVKQSIYRFRHADPTLFLDKYRRYTPWKGQPAAGADGGRIVLGANFRSRAGVVDGTNFLFRQIMTASVGELDYDRDAELVCRAGFPPLPGEEGAPPGSGAEPPGAASAGAAVGRPSGPPIEVHLLDRAVPDEPAGEDGAPNEEEAGGEEDPAAAELADLTAMEREARLVARRIKQLVEGTFDSGPLVVWDRKLAAYRRVQYRDIVILLRATTGRANVFLEVLQQHGIPAYAQLSTGYFAATEVEVMISLLQVLDNPRQDIPLAAVLRSPIIGLSAADLARVRMAAPGGRYYDALVEAARAGQEDESGLRAVLAGFIRSLDRWRTAARRKPLSEVIWQIYQETGYLHYVAGMPGGAQRQANLLALYDRARQFDQFARQGLFRFLRFIERLREEEADMGAAPAIGEGEDVVRIMSIHKSKGLEFPVTIIAGMGTAFSKQDLQGDLLLHRKLGLGPHLVDPDLRVKYPTLAFHAVRESVRLSALAEELRVLYVALTRARERLILVGTSRDLARSCERWATAVGVQGWPLPDTLLASVDCYLDWLGPALMRHRSGALLREMAGVGAPADPTVAGDPSQWQIYTWDQRAQQVLMEPPQAKSIELPLNWEQIGSMEPLQMPPNPEATAELERRFGWQYPYAPVVSRFAKLSVTELKATYQKDELAAEAEEALATDGGDTRAAGGEAGSGSAVTRSVSRQVAGGSLERRPRFMQEGRRSLSPTELGTLMHLVLQHLDLYQPLDELNVAVQVQELVRREVITEAQARAVDTAAIARFFASPLGQRIRERPDRVRREVSFTLGMPAAEVYGDLPPEVAAGETVIIQGMVDLLLETDEGFILVDYKTDRREPEDAAQRYTVQIETYSRAVEQILGKPVVEAYLHFLAADRSVLVRRAGGGDERGSGRAAEDHAR